MALSGQQFKQLQDALIDAFIDKVALEQMLLFGLERNLRKIVGEGSLNDIILLEQLKTAIEFESSLGDEDKADALEHVQTLAEAGQKPKEGAIQALKGIFSSLPDVAKLAEAGKTLIPLIGHIFGL